MSAADPSAASYSLSLDVRGLPPEDAVNQMVEKAVAMKASDLFFCTNENNVTIAMRHLGLLRRVAEVPVEYGRRCLAHLKAIAGMDTTERRRPHDGRRVFRRDNGAVIDLRINTIPTLYGEDLTLRVLQRTAKSLDLDQLGLLRHEYNRLLNMLQSPSGMILVTGPTGSGKTTTLYACLAYLNTPERKINTIEDPIEYSLENIRQSQVNPRLQVGFPDLLRSVLRQSPDILMIGEIRDPETAETAVRAANSGHLVLATLHAPVAAGAVQSMLALGVHPHFLASSLLGCLAQRLLRVLCPHCKVSFELAEPLDTFKEVERWLEPGQGQQLFGRTGCEHCHGGGYISRSGVFEVLPISPAIRKLILTRQPMQALRHKAIEEGMIEFRQAALLKVAQGQTTVEEVFRSVPSEYLGLDD
jgi:type II secretory ATPase GspE/PulE/Tfp pilus assembly ATPase PilB-like protein